MKNNNKQIEIPIAADEMDGVETSTQNKLSSMQIENSNKQKEVMGTPLADERHDVVTSRMRKSLNCLHSYNSECCIYKVPEFVRKEKEECYRPSVISIGPIFYNEPQLQTMQHLKWICLDSFLQRPDNACPDLDGYVQTVRRFEEDIRNCYQEQEKLSKHDDFIEMIVLDAVFLLYLCTSPILPYKNKHHVLKPCMLNDLLLEENQLPFFVLKEICSITYPKASASFLIGSARDFIGSLSIHGSNYVARQDPGMCDALDGIAHLLDLWWNCCRLSIAPRKQEDAVITVCYGADFCRKCCLDFWWQCCCSTNAQDQPNNLPKSAKELNAAGVKFRTNNSLFDIKFDKSTGVLQIPQLHLDDGAEAILRSILLFEQCHYLCQDHTCFIDFISFLDDLIDTVEDIHILKRNGILPHLLGSDKEAANLINNIGKNMALPSTFNYSGVSKELNAYANKSCNRWKAILRRDYFGHPWAIISFISAIIFLVLTVIQTITGFNKH